MTRTARLQAAGWAAFLGAALAWYAAHELGLYFAAFNCRQPWVVPAVHALALAAALACAALAFQARTAASGTPGGRIRFAATLGMAAGALFALVILWQGVAALVYSGCER